MRRVRLSTFAFASMRRQRVRSKRSVKSRALGNRWIHRRAKRGRRFGGILRGASLLSISEAVCFKAGRSGFACIQGHVQGGWRRDMLTAAGCLEPLEFMECLVHLPGQVGLVPGHFLERFSVRENPLPRQAAFLYLDAAAKGLDLPVEALDFLLLIVLLRPPQVDGSGEQLFRLLFPLLGQQCPALACHAGRPAAPLIRFVEFILWNANVGHKIGILRIGMLCIFGKRLDQILKARPRVVSAHRAIFRELAKPFQQAECSFSIFEFLPLSVLFLDGLAEGVR